MQHTQEGRAGGWRGGTVLIPPPPRQSPKAWGETHRALGKSRESARGFFCFFFVSSCRERKEAGRKQTRGNAERDGIESSVKERPRERRRRLKAVTKIKKIITDSYKPKRGRPTEPLLPSLPPLPCPISELLPVGFQPARPTFPSVPPLPAAVPLLVPTPCCMAAMQGPAGLQPDVTRRRSGLSWPGRNAKEAKRIQKEAERNAGWGN